MEIRQRTARASSRVEIPVTNNSLAYHARRSLLILGLAAATYSLFPASPAVDVPIFEVGSVATDIVIAPFAYTVRKSESDLAQEREELARSAKPIFVYVPAAHDSSIRAITRFTGAIADAAAAASGRQGVAAVQRASEAHRITLSPAEAEYLPTGRSPAFLEAASRA